MAWHAWLKDTLARQLSLFEEPTPQQRPTARPTAPRGPATGPSRSETPASVNTSGSSVGHAYTHPQANRRIRLSGRELSYLLKRGRRRTIGLQITVDGLSVSAPSWTGVREIESVLLAKSDWVLKKLEESRDKAAKRDANRIRWTHGEEIPYLGRPIRLALHAEPAGKAANGATRVHRAQPQLVISADEMTLPELQLGLPIHADEAAIRDAAQTWLKRQALRVFAERLQHFAPLIGVQHTRLRLSNANTRWGSATSDGAIRLNWRLIHLPQRSIDYVTVHELSHLREMNHSPQFWRVVEAVMPDYAERRKELKKATPPKWD